MKENEAFCCRFRLLEKDYSPSQVGLFANEVGSTGQRRCGVSYGQLFL